MTAKVRVSLATGDDREDWDSLVRESEDSEIYHFYEWRYLYETVFRHDCYYLLARAAEGRAAGLLPLVHLKSRIFGNFLVSVPCFNYCGILSDSAGTQAALIERASALADDLGASHVELRHRATKALTLPFRDDKVSMHLELPATEDELWRGLTSKLRAQIRRPQKEGAVSEVGGPELLDDFYAVFARNMRDLGTPVYPKRLFTEICARFTEDVRFFVVRLKATPVAAGFTIGHRGTLEIPSASSLREYNRYSPNMLLYWSILRFAIEHGYKNFDFGRTTRDSGPYRFKKQWGAVPTPLAWHYVLKGADELPKINPDNAKYQLAVNLWRRLPVPVANLLGPQVVKHLP